MNTALLLLVANLSAPALDPEKISLDGAWHLSQTQRHIDIPAKVPGVVQVDLLRSRLIPDPFVGANEKKVQWVSDLPWSYSRSFAIGQSFLNKRSILLRCEGLDTFATILVNGRQLAKTDNMFRTWEFDVKPYLHVGSNKIKVDFESVGSFMKRNENRPQLFGKPVQNKGWSYVRKAPFQGGWDFAPKILTTGIWRSIGLEGWTAARIEDVNVTQDHSTKGRVGLTVRVAADTSEATTARSLLLFKGRRVTESETKLRAGAATTNLVVKAPKLWWPNEMGPQNLYDVQVQLRDRQGRLLDKTSKRIGLRTIEWIPKTATTPLTLKVNGRRFFAKGSNWVPPDSLLRTTPAEERNLVQMAVDSHMNLMRLWGGGFYEEDAFLDACDEKGLLVWFEFKYADSPYPSFDPQWLANARAEAEDNVRRVRNHPSIAIYSGNNEVIGFIRDKTTESSMTKAEYDLLFHDTLREVVRNLAPTTAYTPGSPEIGDDHFWNVWHGSAGFPAYLTRHGFMSEYGFQAFPSPRSVDQFTKAEDRASVETPVMLDHQKNWRDGNALIVSSLLRSYRKPKDFESTLWLGQINQAAGITMGVEHWRRDWPNSTASLVWQFNDPWPVTSWSMIDYFGRPKALYYKLKRAYSPVALSGLVDAKTRDVELWVVNDRPKMKPGVIEWRLVQTNGHLIAKGTRGIEIPAGPSSRLAAKLNLGSQVNKVGASDVLLWVSLRAAGEPESQTALLFEKPKDVNLAPPEIATTISKTKDGFRVALRATKPALDAWVSLEGLDAQYSDNFVNLVPEEPSEIYVKTRASLEKIIKALRTRSLYDTFRPGTEANPLTNPNRDGRVVATAENAEIVGDGAILENGSPSNIGNWQNVSDSLRWHVRGARVGTYVVTAEVSIPSSEAGSTFEVRVNGSKVAGKVPPTKGWTDYVEITLGSIQVPTKGDITIELVPTGKPSDHVMNLRNVTFTPVKPTESGN